jgi:hypothetical protein
VLNECTTSLVGAELLAIANIINGGGAAVCWEIYIERWDTVCDAVTENSVGSEDSEVSKELSEEKTFVSIASLL